MYGPPFVWGQPLGFPKPASKAAEVFLGLRFVGVIYEC